MARSTDETGMASENLTAEEQAAMDADKAAEIEYPPEDGPAEPAPETAEGTAPEGQDPPQRQGMVPHAALHEERTKRQETERQLVEARKTQQTLEERTNLILQRFAAPQPQQPQQPPQNQPTAPEMPAFDQDPAGHILAQQRQQQAIINELVQAVVGQGRQSEAASAAQQLDTRAAALEREFSAVTPDYDKASAHLFEMRRQELAAAGWNDPVEVQHMMANEARGLAMQAIRQGRNPAEVVYNLAKLRGFSPPSAAPAPPANGEDQLRTIDAGQQQSRSVGNMRGAGPSPMTAERLYKMSEADFIKMIDTLEGKALMGA